MAESFIINYELKPKLLKSIDPGQFPPSLLTILSMLHNWLAETDGTCSTVTVALLDFRKAFDLSDHNFTDC